MLSSQHITDGFVSVHYHHNTNSGNFYKTARHWGTMEYPKKLRRNTLAYLTTEQVTREKV
jgi:hypothetical protein